MRHILFICTGNYYRSRFAEALFNHRAWGLGIPWRAFSRGLATHMVQGLGDLSVYTRFALTARGIALRHTAPNPRPLTLEDLEMAERSIALKEDEHRSMMRDQFPEWENRIEYWAVHDLDFSTPEEALPQIEKQVLQVLDSLLDTSSPAAETKKKP